MPPFACCPTRNETGPEHRPYPVVIPVVFTAPSLSVVVNRNRKGSFFVDSFTSSMLSVSQYMEFSSSTFETHPDEPTTTVVQHQNHCFLHINAALPAPCRSISHKISRGAAAAAETSSASTGELSRPELPDDMKKLKCRAYLCIGFTNYFQFNEILNHFPEIYQRYNGYCTSVAPAHLPVVFPTTWVFS